MTFGWLTANIFIFLIPFHELCCLLSILQENEQDRRQAQVGDIIQFNKKFFILSKHRHGGQSSISRCQSTVLFSPRGEKHSLSREAAQASERYGEGHLQEAEDLEVRPHSRL